ncbi:unnamed protein product, partial [Meganyctiphanes norvegica]
MSQLHSGTQGSLSSRSAPPTPSHSAQVSSMESLSSLHMDGNHSGMSSVFSSDRSNYSPDTSPQGSLDSVSQGLRNDLLVAADSVTNAMSSLVRELNSESSDEDSRRAPVRSTREYDLNHLYKNSSAWRSMSETSCNENESPFATRTHRRK